MYYLYKITNLINNKVYIGQTINPRSRWSSHKSESRKDNPEMLISKRIKYYGIDNFSFDIIAVCTTLDNCNLTEQELILQYESHVSTGKGYNIDFGGQVKKISEETLNKKYKLKLEQRKFVLDCYKKSLYTCKELAKILKVSKYTIYDTVNKIKVEGSFKQISKIPNSGSFKKGKGISKTSFKEGHLTWNKGTKGVMKAWNKGLPGKTPANAKLTFEIAEQIREEYKLGNTSSIKLAKKYNVVKCTILKIIHNKYYTKKDI